MAKYQPHALLASDEISKLCTESLTTMRNNDKINKLISKQLDHTIKNVDSNNSISYDEIHNINLLRNTLDIITSANSTIALKNYDLINQHINNIDNEIKLLQNTLQNNNELNSNKKKRKHDSATSSAAPATSNIDPNEPLYCVCNRVAFGDMIACDNEECPIEWFHYSCVNLTRQPRNSWLCPTCSYEQKKKK